MNELRLIIDEIQRILRSPSPDSASVRHAAAEYQLVCDQANDRLRQCEELLRLGMRSEAVRQCEQEPNLLKLVNVLDFSELPHWHVLLSRCGIDAQCGVLVDVAAELNEAYTKESRMAMPLRNHRLLALARAPLKERLLVLNQLRNLDSENESWDDDLASYQKTRLSEIEVQATRSADRNDLESLESLDRELNGDGWIHPPSETVLQHVAWKLKEQRVYHARIESQSTAPALADALARKDVVEGSRLRERWDYCQSTLNSQLDPDLEQMVSPALQWLAEHDEQLAEEQTFQQATSNLEGVLARQHTREQLREAYQDVMGFGRPIDDELLRRAKRRLLWLGTTSWFRRTTWVACAVILILAVVAGLNWAQERARDRARLQQDENRLLSLIRADDYDGASKVRADIGPRWNMLAVGTRNKYKSLRDQHEFKKVCASFQEKLEGASRRLSSVKSLTDIKRHDHLLQELSGEFDEYCQTLGQELPQDQRHWISTFRAKLRREETSTGALRDKLQRAEHIAHIRTYLNENEFDSARRLLEQLSKTTREPNSQRDLIALWRSYGVRVEATKSESISETIGDIGRFEQHLTSLRVALGQTPWAEHLDSVAKEKPIWDDVIRFGRLIARWSQRPPPDSSRQAKAWLDRLNKIGSEPLSPIRAKFAERITPHLTKIAARDAEDLQGFGKLKKVLQARHIHDLYVIEAMDDSRFYSTHPEPQNDTGGRYAATVLTGFGNENLIQKEFVRLGQKTSTNVGPRAIFRSWSAAPHSQLAEAIERSLEKQPKRWDERMGDAIGLLLTRAADVEPFVLLELLDSTIELARQGSHAWHESLKEAETIVKADDLQELLNFKWMRPFNKNNQAVKAMREDAERRVQAVEALWDVIQQEWEQHDQEFRHPVRERYRWVGWVGHDENGPILRLTKDFDEGHLVVFTLSRGAQQIETHDLGSWGGEKHKGMALGEKFYGRPVFLQSMTD